MELPAYFDSQTQAAAMLNISVYDVKAAKAAGCPAFRGGGRIYRRELEEFLKKQAKKQRRAGRCDDVALSKEKELRLRAMQVDVDRKEFELQRLKDRTRPLAQFEFCLQRMCSALLAALNALPGRAAPLLIGLDFHDLKRKLEEEVEIVKRTIRAKDYLPVADPGIE